MEVTPVLPGNIHRYDWRVCVRYRMEEVPPVLPSNVYRCDWRCVCVCQVPDGGGGAAAGPARGGPAGQ